MWHRKRLRFPYLARIDLVVSGAPRRVEVPVAPRLPLDAALADKAAKELPADGDVETVREAET